MSSEFRLKVRQVVSRGIFVGMSTLDVVYGVQEFPAANSKVMARSHDLFAGGPACNAAITFSHLGGKATLVTALGRHLLVGIVRQELQRYSVQAIDLNPAFDIAPTISSITVNRAGERNIVSANASRLPVPPAQVDETAVGKASVLLVDGHYMQACQAWAAAAHARGTPVVLDGGSWKDGTEELLRSVATAICSADFLPPGCSTKRDVLEFLKGHGIRNAAITHGPDPIRFISDTGSGEVSVPQVEVLDTMGAGDVFHGAFCYFSSIGHGFVQALGEAAAVAAQSCRFRGTRQWTENGGPV